MLAMNDSNRSSRRGPARLPRREKRDHCVSTRFNNEELSQLDDRRGVHQRGQWLRMVALDNIPPTIPTLNQQAWLALERLAKDLKQVPSAEKGNGLKSHQTIVIADLMDAISTLRLQLLGVKP